jgi:hypothetical protein
MMIKVRDLRELGAAVKAEEGVCVGELVSVEAIFRSLEGEGANAIFLHAATIFEMVEEG